MGHACPWLYTPVLYLTIGVNMNVLSRCRGLGHKHPTLLDDEFWLGVVVLSGFEAILLRDFENYCGELRIIYCAIATTSKLRFERSGTASVVHSIRSW
jgi:hypothetical protein